MGNFTAGLVTGCLLGVGGTFLLILFGAVSSGDLRAFLKGHLLRGGVYALALLGAGAGISHIMNLGKDSTVLLFLLLVLIVERQAGLASGLFASFIATLILSIWVFPPIGSLMIDTVDDRLALALFLLIAILGAQIFHKKEKALP